MLHTYVEESPYYFNTALKDAALVSDEHFPLFNQPDMKALMCRYTRSLCSYTLSLSLVIVCHRLSSSVLLSSSRICSRLSLNELQIMFKCNQRHFQLFQTVIQPGKLLSTHTHTHRCRLFCLAVYQELWHLRRCTVIILQ